MCGSSRHGPFLEATGKMRPLKKLNLMRQKKFRKLKILTSQSQAHTKGTRSMTTPRFRLSMIWGLGPTNISKCSKYMRPSLEYLISIRSRRISMFRVKLSMLINPTTFREYCRLGIYKVLHSRSESIPKSFTIVKSALLLGSDPFNWKMKNDQAFTYLSPLIKQTSLCSSHICANSVKSLSQ